MSIWYLHIDAIRLGKSLPPAFNQASRFQFGQCVLDSHGAAVNRISDFADGKDDVDLSLIVLPAISEGEIGPVQQNGIQQLGKLRQIRLHQKTGVGQVGRQFGVGGHVIGNRVHLPIYGPLESRFWGSEWKHTGPLSRAALKALI